jgi:hypothetical protein
VVIAPDKFKGSLSAEEVAAHLARGLAAAVPAVRDRDLFGHYAGDRRGQAPGQVRGHLLGGQ